MELSSSKTIRKIKTKYGFQLSKSLGQNFIVDKGVIRNIIEGSGAGSEDLIIEIGPGVGVLTAEAARTAAKVVAVEIDEKLIPILNETLSEFSNVDVINQDVLKTDINQLIAEEREKNTFTGKVKIMGNLPYYITTPIIMKILGETVNVDGITIMMQKEVADRIRSGPGSKAYGALSVAVQYYCDIAKVASVPKEAFIPRPKVDSTVLNLSPIRQKRIQVKDEEIFFECVKAGFAQRRKTLLNSLSGAGGMDKKQVETILQAVGIDPGRRAETLTIEEFGRLADEVANGKSKNSN